MKEIVEALAARLASLGVGAWSPDGVLPLNTTGIVCGIEPDKPDSIIVMNVYSVTTEPASGDDQYGVQAKIRDKDLESAADLAEAVILSLDLLGNVSLGDVRLTKVRLSSVASLGQDDKGRVSYTLNFYVWRPSTEDMHS